MSQDDADTDFPPHLFAMWRMRHRKEWQPLPAEERTAYNNALRQRLREVPAEERPKLIANLELDWAALPPGQRAKYSARIGGRAERAADKAQGKEGSPPAAGADEGMAARKAARRAKRQAAKAAGGAASDAPVGGSESQTPE